MVHKLKALVITLIILGSALRVYGQNTLGMAFIQNGDTCQFRSVFADSTDITFFVDENAPKGHWALAVLEDDEYKDITVKNNENRELVFSPSEVYWRWATRLFNEEGDCDIFRLKVQYVSGYTTEINYLDLALLPSRPRITNVQYIYSYDWSCDYMDENSLFSFDVKSKRADLFLCLESDSHLFPSSDRVYFTAIYPYKQREELHVDFNSDWGEYLMMAAENSFGRVYGDTVYTTSYIVDEDILNRLAELEVRADIDSVINRSHGVKVVGRKIIFENTVKAVYIINYAGIVCVKDSNVNSMDVLRLPNGIYILGCIDDKNRINNIKIVLQ